MVTRYREVRLNDNNNNNNNNNNNKALVERFQPSALHKLRQLGLYTNKDTLDIAHQFDAEAVATEAAYTTTNTQPSCSEAEEPDCTPNTFKETMGLAQAAHWKAVSDKKLASLEKRGVFKLVTNSSGKREAITISQKD